MKKYIPRSDLVETKYKKGSKDNNIVTLFILSLDSILKIQENILGFDQIELWPDLTGRLWFLIT